MLKTFLSEFADVKKWKAFHCLLDWVLFPKNFHKDFGWNTPINVVSVVCNINWDCGNILQFIWKGQTITSFILKNQFLLIGRILLFEKGEQKDNEYIFYLYHPLSWIRRNVTFLENSILFAPSSNTKTVTVKCAGV